MLLMGFILIANPRLVSLYFNQSITPSLYVLCGHVGQGDKGGVGCKEWHVIVGFACGSNIGNIFVAFD